MDIISCSVVFFYYSNVFKNNLLIHDLFDHYKKKCVALYKLLFEIDGLLTINILKNTI